MLEGSATYVAAPGFTEAWNNDAAAGLALLEQIRAIDRSSEATHTSRTHAEPPVMNRSRYRLIAVSRRDQGNTHQTSGPNA